MRRAATPAGSASGPARVALGVGCDDGDVSPRSLPPAVPVTVLRVYEPADVFAAQEWARWSAELGRPDAAERAEQAERREAWRRLVRGARGRSPAAQPGPDGAHPVVAEDGEDPLAGHVRILRVEGAALLCPASLGDGDDGPRRALVRAWDLPVPWLIVVGLSAVAAADGVSSPGRYLAPMARARAQAARALRTTRTGPGGADVGVELEVLARWLEGFHPRSWLELDARPVAALVGGDDGLEDVRLGMECLASGDVIGATVVYQRLRQRSRALTDISRLS